MNAKARPCALTVRGMVATALLAIVIAGCGKSAPVQTGSARTSHPQPHAQATAVTLLNSAGAGGVTTGSTSRLGGATPTVDAAAVARTIYPGITNATRPKAVVIVDARDWPAALAASALAAAPLRAPILYSEGGRLSAVSAEALAAMHPTGSAGLHGAQVIDIGDIATPNGYKALRLRGADDYRLAARIAALLAKLSGHATTSAIIVDTGERKALTMPAATLAAESGAPILFAKVSEVPQATSGAIEGISIHSLYVLGPPAAIGAQALGSLQALAAVTRIGDDDIVENAIKVAAFTNGQFGWGVEEPGHGLVFARASAPFDAPAASLLSSSADYGPLLLLQGSEGVPAALIQYLRDIQPGYGAAPQLAPVRGVYNHGWLIGDEQAISLRTQAELDGMLRSVRRESAEATGESAIDESGTNESE